MNPSRGLVEVSWEVGHKVGGVHAVVSTRARSLVERYGEGYLAVGPWLLSEGNADRFLDPDPALEGFAEGCRAAGLPVRAGRWLIPGRPQTLLVEFSRLYAERHAILEGLWNDHRVDSLKGDWEYVEPVLFGHAAGLVVERWLREMRGGGAGTVVQFHEWLSAAGLLGLRQRVPAAATLFTVHSTVLGRALGEGGRSPAERLGGRTPEVAAAERGVTARHSMETAAARTADVLAAVSAPAAEECEAFLGRAADRLLPNGIDLDVIARRVGGVTRKQARENLRDVAVRLLGPGARDAAMVCTAGRYEFRNKGFDLLLDAAAEINSRPGPPMVLFMFVPAGTSSVRGDVAERLAAAHPYAAPMNGVATHVLLDPDGDAIARRCAERGLRNAPESRVKILHVPAYMEGGDGVFNRPLEAVVQGVDLTLLPSWYDAWGCTPQESLALGVPTMTSDAAGFGVWAMSRGLDPSRGVHVLRRRGRSDGDARADLAAILEGFLAAPPSRRVIAPACRDAVRPTVWDRLVGDHEAAFDVARERAAARAPARDEGPAPARRRVHPRSHAVGVGPRFGSVDVYTELPEELRGLRTLAWNWRWTWDPLARSLFHDLSPQTWERVRGNPARLLLETPPEELRRAASDRSYRARIAAAVKALDAYMAEPPRARGAVTVERPVAYLSAEYGLHECMPVYSGGLGVLSGDHLRAASDIGMPLVAVGILYRRGYLRQRMDGGVTQRALEDPLDPALLPLDPVLDAQGREVRVTLSLPGATLSLRAWRAQVGRVALLLLDADIPSNRPEDRAVTHHLYGGDGEYRIRQEIVLGRGAVRLLDRLEVRPSLWHLNEGHGAFAPLERVGALVRHGGLTFDEAREVVRAGTLFTTHTPVPAGHDRFSEDLVRRYFSDIASWAGIPWERFLALGSTVEDPGLLNMTALALQFSGRVNGVSREHGRVSRELFRALRPQLLPEEMPVSSVTNGVHLGTWTGPEVAERLGAKGRPVVAADFAAAVDLAPATLWEARNAARSALLRTVRRRLERTFHERGDSPVLLERILGGLDDGALFIGFARRFATYKRADLMLRDAARLRALLGDSKRPVRILLAGKSHPADGAARELLARVAQLARGDEFAGRLILLEDYDIGLGRALVQGVDVWLNTPRPPMEASGTSGMKAAINGVLNLSVADGWWPEGYDRTNGWQIGPDLPSAGGPTSTDTAARDAQDADSLYRLLEEEVVPEFFKRNRAGVPLAWVERVRRSLVTLAPAFDACRMVEEYATWAYAPLAGEGAALAAEGYLGARALAERRVRLHRGMDALRILTATPCGGATLRPGERFSVSVEVDPGSLLPVEIVVELVFGRRGEDGNIVHPSIVSLAEESPPEGGVLRYGGSCPVETTGAFAWSVRVRPAGSSVPGLHDPVKWM